MNWFYDLKIARKLIVTFLAVIVLVGGLGFYAIDQLDKVNQASTNIATNWLPSIRVLSQIELRLARVRSYDQQHVLATPEQRAGIEKTLATQVTELATLQKKYAALITEPEEKTLYPETAKLIDEFLGEHQKIIAASSASNTDEARELLRGRSAVTYRQAQEQLERLTVINDSGADGSNKSADTIYGQARLGIFILMGVCIALSISLAMWVARVIARPLSAAVEVAQRVADGDLTADIQSASKDETGQLLRALKVMNDNLLRIVGEVRQGTDTIATASSEIASGNLDLSSRTEEQASSLEETASAMEELTSTVKQNADNARQANNLATSASEVAVRGGDVVGQVVGTMSSINESSKKIVDIIGVIDGIAFQTNILALNAAVEAARAGEQGRGFAVVASEVRSLAQRSAAAAKEIKGLIDDSVAKVGVGSRLVHEAGVTMNDVVESVKRVTDIVGEISSASQEQSSGIEQINQAITQMDEVTQQNAALVEQAAAAAQSLQDQAGKLSEVVGIFKLSNVAIGKAPVTHRKPAVNITPRPSALTTARKNIRATPAKPALTTAATKDDGGSWEEF